VNSKIEGGKKDSHSQGNNTFIDLDVQFDPFFNNGNDKAFTIFLKYYYSYTFMRSGYQKNETEFYPGAKALDTGIIVGVGFTF
jgi:hypothetical protein